MPLFPLILDLKDEFQMGIFYGCLLLLSQLLATERVRGEVKSWANILMTGCLVFFGSIGLNCVCLSERQMSDHAVMLLGMIIVIQSLQTLIPPRSKQAALPDAQASVCPAQFSIADMIWLATGIAFLLVAIRNSCHSDHGLFAWIGTAGGWCLFPVMILSVFNPVWPVSRNSRTVSSLRSCLHSRLLRWKSILFGVASGFAGSIGLAWLDSKIIQPESLALSNAVGRYAAVVVGMLLGAVATSSTTYLITRMCAQQRNRIKIRPNEHSSGSDTFPGKKPLPGLSQATATDSPQRSLDVVA